MVKNRRFEETAKGPIFGIRHLQCFLLFWGISIAYAMRVNMSLAIVAMTDKKSTNQNFPEYSWSEKQKSFVLSSFFSGYILTQILGGFLARKFGGKVSIFIGIGISSILAILTPFAVSVGNWPLLSILRAVQGMTQGVLFPTTHTLLAKWAPEEERAILGTYCYNGAQFGTVVMLGASGFIASSFLGWPSIFYISGGLGVLWVLAWHVWGASSPEDYSSISVAEKEFILKSISNGKEKSDQSSLEKRHLKIPLWKFLTSPPFWALAATHCAFTWGFWTILAQIPSYMKNILGFNIKSNALLTALPYLVMLVLGYAFAFLSSWIDRKKFLTLTQSRKVFNTISAWIPAVALICLGYVDADHTELAVGLLILAVGFTAAMHMGFSVNHIDLSPNFAGIMLGITNTAANCMSLLAPLSVGLIVSDEKNPFQWRIVFFVSAGFCFLGNLLFIIFGSAEVQPWNDPEASPDKGHEFKPIKDADTEKAVE